MAIPRKLNPKKGGGKTKYRPEYAKQAAQLIADGKNQRQCQDFFGVSRTTWGKWKVDFPEFGLALEDSLAGKIKKVEDALYRRCLGYTYTQITKAIELTCDGKKKQTKKEIERHILGDVIAQKFFLINRDSKNWSSVDKKDDKDSMDANIEMFQKRIAEMDKSIQGKKELEIDKSIHDKKELEIYK